MTEPKPQSFKNHGRFDPPFHFVASGLILATFIIEIIVLVRSIMAVHGRLIAVWMILTTVALLITLLKTRLYALKVQDRVIRLEERLRLATLLPDKLKNRIGELTEDQLVGLRFASDAEISALVELALDKHLNRKEIKERIQNWRPDNWRV
jgi:hypothetical protein